MIAATLIQTIALVGGTVHSLAPGAEPSVATVLLDGERIHSVGPDLAIPEGCKTIDLTGLHLVPGLIDGMMNHDPEHDALYLRSGVTLCRDTGNDLASIVTQKGLAERNRIPGPELFICGQVFDGLSSGSTDALRLLNAEVVPGVVNALFEALEKGKTSVEYLSFLETIPVDSWGALIQEARKRDLSVWGPLPKGVAMLDAVQQGQAGFLSIQAILPTGSTWLAMDEAKLSAHILALRDAQIGVTPLLSAYGRMLDSHDTERAMEFMGPFYESTWMQELESWKTGVVGEKREELQRVVDAQGRALKQMHEAGVPLVPGSASPNSWLIPGEGLVGELERWAQAGIPRDAVLAYATREAARTLGVLRDHGTLEPGKWANIVVLGSDPLRSLGALRIPEIVVMRGQVLERRDILKRVQDLKDLQTGVRADLAKEIDVAAPNANAGDLILQGRAETLALGSRLCVEHFVVRRLSEERWLYATRMIYPKTAAEPAKEVHLVQLMDGSLLERFDLRISEAGVQTTAEQGPSPDAPEGSSLTGQEGADTVIEKPLGILQVRGTRIEGTKIVNIEHRKDGLFLSSLRSKETLTSVDVSLALNALIAGKHCPEGKSLVVAFEGSALEPVVDQWTLSKRPADNLIQMHTSRGVLAFGFEANGSPVFAGRQRGNSQLYLQLIGELETFGGPGLALPKDRVYQPAPSETGKTEASTPK